jgi:hypothetical protein
VAVHGRASTEDERAARAAYWRRDRLAPIADALSPEWEGRYAELVGQLGEGDPILGRRVRRVARNSHT